jgi:hypothetical protein
LGKSSYPLLVPLLKSLGELHEPNKDFGEFPASDALQSTFAAAISSMGPEKFLSVLPLNIEENE